MVVLARRPDLEPADFKDYFLRVHTPLAEALPALARYHLNWPAEDEARPAPAWDLIVELYWPDRAAMEAAWASPQGRAATDDLAHCADLDRTSWSIVEVEARRD